MQQDGAGGEGNNIHLLLSILADGEQQARQLAETMVPDDPRLGGAVDHYRGAARRLQRTLGKAVSVARVIEAAAAAASRGTDSPRSADESSGGTAAVEPLERPGMCKRRKGLPRWTAKFRLPDASSEATPDDGFSWRKYGQKDILGAKFPRGYYRCTYRGAQGCLATKQVQRSDSDLCVFDVTYHGEHTCHQKPQHQQQRHAYASTASPRGATGIVGHPPPPPPPPLQDPSTELVTGFEDCLKVETADASPLHDHDRDYHNSSAAAPFTFPSAVPPHAAGPSFSPSPAAAGSSYYAVPHCLVSPGSGNSYDDYSSCYSYGCARGAESELAEVFSRATSAPAATVGTAAAADLSAAAAGFDYSLYHHDEFDPHLPFAPSGAGSGPPRH